MIEFGIFQTLGLALVLGLIGFIEPCPIGTGLVFGLNIPACAAPLVLVLLGLAAAGGATASELGRSFASLATFGLALSLPLFLAVFFAPARAALDWLAALSRRIPRWTGMLLMALGIWSIWFALVVPM